MTPPGHEKASTTNRESIAPPIFVDAIVLNTQATSGRVAQAREVIEMLLERLADSGHVRREDLLAVSDAVMRRESLGTTGIGAGVAVPHARTRSVTQMVGIVGLCRPAIDFQSLDGELADIVILLLAPPPPPNVYMSMRIPPQLERLHRRLADQKYLLYLRGAETDSQLYERVTRDAQGAWGLAVLGD